MDRRERHDENWTNRLLRDMKKDTMREETESSEEEIQKVKRTSRIFWTRSLRKSRRIALTWSFRSIATSTSARYKPYLKHASQYLVGMEVMEIPGKDWTEIVRAAMKRITIQRDGRPRIEGLIPTKSAKARSYASNPCTPLCGCS